MDKSTKHDVHNRRVGKMVELLNIAVIITWMIVTLIVSIQSFYETNMKEPIKLTRCVKSDSSVHPTN